MNFLITDDSVSIINSDNIKLGQKVPKGFWKTVFDKHQGCYLTKIEFKIAHGKVYGNSQQIADHIVEAFRKNPKDKNLGVLLSGDRGLGKTLTSRLVVEKLAKDYPIVIVSEYLPSMPDFMEYLKGCVIVMDEFEKFMKGNASGSNAEDELSKQESMLSLLDGNTGSSGNLFLLTANDVNELNQNLKSRPGRIRYHYRYESEKADVIRDYCKDNLDDKSKIEEVVKVLGAAAYVSMDIITAFVDELNQFPKTAPRDIVKYFNIESGSKPYIFTITIREKESGDTYTFERRSRYVNYDTFNLVEKDKRRYQAASQLKELNFDPFETLVASIDSDYMPAYIIGKMPLPIDCCEISDLHTFDDACYSFVDADVEIESVTVENPSAVKYVV